MCTNFVPNNTNFIIYWQDFIQLFILHSNKVDINGTLTISCLSQAESLYCN